MTDKEPDESRMVKKFRRAAAGLEEQLPSDLRPPSVLKRTCDYLFEEVIGGAPSLAQVHHFVWDRTRAIRNDLSIQQVTRPEELRIAVECYERIARFHILSLHQLALPEKPYSKYDWQQEREQLDRTLLSLMQMYDDSRGRIDLPNEPEFRAYCVIFQLQDPTPDLEDRVQSWPRTVIQDTRVQKAIDLYMAACNVMDAQGPLKPRANHLIARQDWQRFWTLTASKEVSYIMACVAEIYFNLVRRTVLNALFRTFRANSSLATTDWTTDVLCEVLAFDDDEEVYTYCERYGFGFKEREDGQQYLDLTSVRGRTLPEPNAGMPKQSKTKLVEDKRYGRTLSAVINGLAVRQAQEVGLVNEVEDDEGMDDVVELDHRDAGLANGARNVNGDTGNDRESLFISDSTTTRSSLSDSNGFQNETPSVFSGLTKAPSFGKPSNFPHQPSVFAQPQNTTTKNSSGSELGSGAVKFDFLKSAPSNTSSTTTTPPPFNFAANAEPPSQQQDETSSKNFAKDRPSTDGPSIFANVTAQIPNKTPLFSFASPTKTTNSEPKAEAKVEASPLSTTFERTPELKLSSQELPKDQVTSGRPAEAPAGPPSPPSQQPETRGSPHFTTSSTSPASGANQSASSSAGLGLGVKRSSFSTDTRPKKPSPLSNSFTANDDNSAIANESVDDLSGKPQVKELFSNQQTRAATSSPPGSKQVGQVTPENVPEDFESIITRLAHELVQEPDQGYLKQYIDFAVRRTVSEVHQQITLERLKIKFDGWKRSSLETKYGRRWRQVFWQRRLIKSGHERRQRRQRRLQQRGSQEIEGSSLIDNRSLYSDSGPGSVSDIPDHDLASAYRMTISEQRLNGGASNSAMASEQQAMAGTKRPASSHDKNKPVLSAASGHKRLKSTSHVDDKGRISKPTATSHPNADILKRSSFLGFSISRDAINNNNNKCTTKSNYFRLKAMGINKADELSGLRGTKRRSESLQTSSQTSPPALRSSITRSSPDRTTNNTLMPPPSSTPQQTSKFNDDDEELFARLKAARENLEESTSYYKSQVGKSDELRQSLGSRSSGDSPSSVKFRADAKLRASISAAGNGSYGTGRHVPAYRLRESKFVPRENYRRAIERAKEIRELRSRDTSRAESRLDQDNVDDAPSRPVGVSQQSDHANHQRPSQTNGKSSIANGPNGFTLDNDTKTQKPAFTSASKPFSFGTQSPISFGDHTTQLSSHNPFLQAAVPKSQGNSASQPAFSAKDKQSIVPDSQDHTINPAQISKSLASSFGSGQGYGQSQFQSGPQYNPTSPQTSYLPSQAISLLSDDENDTPAASTNHHQVRSAADTDGMPVELLDQSTEDEVLDSYGQGNPYAALADEGEDEHETGSDSWHGQLENHLQYDEDEDEDEDEDDELFHENYSSVPNGYSGHEDEDEDAVDGDIDEDETDDVDDIDEDEDEEGYIYEDGEEEEQNEKNPPEQWQRKPFGQARNAPPQKNAAFQSVGNTVEEAIELSD